MNRFLKLFYGSEPIMRETNQNKITLYEYIFGFLVRRKVFNTACHPMKPLLIKIKGIAYSCEKIVLLLLTSQVETELKGKRAIRKIQRLVLFDWNKLRAHKVFRGSVKVKDKLLLSV